MLRTGLTVLIVWMFMGTAAWAGTPPDEQPFQSCEEVMAVVEPYMLPAHFERLRAMSEPACLVHMGQFTPSELAALLAEGNTVVRGQRGRGWPLSVREPLASGGRDLRGCDLGRGADPDRG